MTNNSNRPRRTVLEKIAIDSDFRQACMDDLYDLLGDDPRFKLHMLTEALDPVDGDLETCTDQYLNAFIDAIDAESEQDLSVALYKIGFLLLTGYLLNEQYTQEVAP